jgi:hypothetical protein
MHFGELEYVIIAVLNLIIKVITKKGMPIFSAAKSVPTSLRKIS